jgi:hypothetical protein
MGEVYHYRDFEKPAQRWSNMEQFHQLKALGLVPDLPPASFKGDTSPCEYAPEWPFVAPEDDPA